MRTSTSLACKDLEIACLAACCFVRFLNSGKRAYYQDIEGLRSSFASEGRRLPGVCFGHDMSVYAYEDDFPFVGSKLFRRFETGVANANSSYRAVFPDCVGCFLSGRPAVVSIVRSMFLFLHRMPTCLCMNIISTICNLYQIRNNIFEAFITLCQE